MKNCWSAPFTGLIYFLKRPPMWGWLLLGTLLGFASIVAAFVGGMVFLSSGNFQSFTGILSAFGWGLFAAVLDIILIFPLFVNFCFTRAFAAELGKEEVPYHEESVISSISSSFIVFFRTLKWRILWPAILLFCLFFASPLVFPITLLAANHLLVLESADLVLSLFGKKAGERVEWVNAHSGDVWRIALSGSLLSFLLSLLLFGWLLWLPALATGVFLWIRESRENAEN